MNDWLDEVEDADGDYDLDDCDDAEDDDEFETYHEILKDSLIERFEDKSTHWDKQQYISKLNYENYIDDMIDKEKFIDFGPKELDKTTDAQK